MRILAALTLLISVSISAISSATPLELKWTVDVDESILGRAELRYMGPMVPTHGGGCIGRAHIALNGADTRLLFATGIFDNEVNGDNLQQGDSFIIL